MQCEACGSSDHSDCCGEGVQEGEICMFPNMPWIHNTFNSTLEAQLIRFKGKDQCRNCGKKDDKIDTTPSKDYNPNWMKEMRYFCSQDCMNKYGVSFEVMIKQGAHLLRIRGFD